MICRVLEVYEENRFLSLRRGFLEVKCGDKLLGSVPLDDIGVLLLSAQGISMTKNVLNALSEKGCVTVLCGANYAPQSMVLPVVSNYHAAKIIKSQIEASLPLKKQIWKQIVSKKIQNQAITLKICNREKEATKLFEIAKTVKSGDPDNREAYAAKIYWRALFGEDFSRSRYGEMQNSFLNYGYAVLRASMARAVCASGLLPSLGIHHDNQLNQFCLVDDLLEVFRPLADFIVFELWNDGAREVDTLCKKKLSSVLWCRVEMNGECSPVFQAMKYFALSYTRALENKVKVVEMPEWTGDISRENEQESAS